MKIHTLSLIALTILLGCTSGGASYAEARQEAPVAKADSAPDSHIAVWAGDKMVPPDASMPVIIDFTADWCGPCRRFKPIFDEVAREFGDRARFVSVNVDANPGTAQAFRVQSIPQVSVLWPDGAVHSTVGFMDLETMRALVDTAIAHTATR